MVQTSISDMVSALNEFSLSLHTSLSFPTRNLVLGSSGVGQVLVMLALACDGPYASQMRSLVGADRRTADAMAATASTVRKMSARTPGESGSIARAVSMVLHDSTFGLSEDYAARAARAAEAGIVSHDIRKDSAGAVGLVNGWVSGATEARIPTLLSSLPADTECVIVNATYLKASWVQRFKLLRRPMPFVAERSSPGPVQAMVKFMETKLEVPSELLPDGAASAAIPYEGDMDLVVMMPPVGTPLEDFERRITPRSVSRVLHLPLSDDGDSVTMPVWSFDTGPVRILPAMISAGMLPPGSLDLSAMTAPGSIPPVLSNVVHQARIDVDEKGTVAASGTAAVVATRSADPMPARRIVFNRPFWYAVIDRRSGLLLFTGSCRFPHSGS